MAIDPFQVVRDLEAGLCEYAGAPYAVATTSCTMALLLSVAWHVKKARNAWGQLMQPMLLPGEELGPMHIEIPKRTYVGVPQAIIHAGGRPVFREEAWCGWYQLKPLPVWDSARWFTSGLYRGHCNGVDHTDMGGHKVCVSFHASKILTDTQGGAILHDDPEADAWLRKARFDGRTEGVHPRDDKFDVLGWHAYLSPDVAARLLWKLSILPQHNDPLPWGPGTASDYPDLSLLEIFK